MASANRMAFTLNNPCEDDVKVCESWKCDYVIVAGEIGLSGTKHLQGYVEWSSSKKFSTCHKYWEGRGHWEKARARSQPNIDYCSKGEQTKLEWDTLGTKGPNYGKNVNILFKFGEPSVGQGSRTDISEALADIESGMCEYDMFVNHSEFMCRYNKAHDRFKLLCDKRKKRAIGFEKPEVLVWWGKTDKQKTRKAHEIDPYLFKVGATTTGFWWDGYDGEETVLIDEFRCDMPLNQLLTLLDGYYKLVKISGSHVVMKAKRFIITSNINPLEWYINCDNESRNALLRRFTEIKEFS